MLKFLALILAVSCCQKAMACDVVIPPREIPEDERARFANGEQCAAQWKGAWTDASISQAEDLGGSFVVQILKDDGGCAAEVQYVVQDCASGRTAIFGGTYSTYELDRARQLEDGSFQVTDFKSYDLMEEIKASIASGSSVTIDSVLAKAETSNVQSVLEAKTDSRVKINGSRFSLGCGCKLYYGG